MFLSTVFTLISQTFSPSLSWEERRGTGDITKKHRKVVSAISIDSLISDVDSGEEERLPGLIVCVGQWGRSDWLQLITTSRQSVWADQTGQLSPAGCHCQDIRRGHYHTSLIPLYHCPQYNTNNAGGRDSNTFTSLCPSVSLSQR